MSKYDHQIDLSPDTSTGLILGKLEKGSLVLEFGCATGRMTRYMKEDLDCQVYIVEYDEGAYAQAARFAEDGVCGDILEYRWAEKFSGLRFDAILFADVLEHLSAPGAVLKRAAALLKDTGSVYISVPNVTHNDILLKAAEGHFDYTSLGLLDDTHVHFWGLENLASLAEQSGLSLRAVESTPCPTGYTEQYGQGVPGRTLLKDLLMERPEGEVYQFVLTLDKREAGDVSYALPPRRIFSTVYLDTGRGFSEAELVRAVSAWSGAGYRARIVVEDTKDLRRLRFDPVEGQSCLLKSLAVCQGGERLSLFAPNGADLGTGLLLLGDDPFVYAETAAGSGPVTIDAEILLWGEAYLETVQEACLTQSGQIGSLTHENGALRGEGDRLKAANTMLHQEKEKLQETLARERTQYAEDRDALNGQIEDLTEQRTELRRTVQELTSENELYALLADRKDRYAMALERELNDYKNLRVVRAYFFVRRAGGKVKRGLKWLLRKPYHALRRCARWGRDAVRRLLRR